MPILPDHLAYGPKGTVFGGPVIGALVTMNITVPVLTGAVATGDALNGVVIPFDCRLMAFTWASENTRTGTNTMALYKHTGVAGATTGTLVMAASSINAVGGTVEGASFASSAARNITKGQALVIDTVLAAAQATGTATEAFVVSLTLMTTGFPLTDMSAV